MNGVVTAGQVPRVTRSVIWILRSAAAGLELWYVFAWIGGYITSSTLIALHFATASGFAALVLVSRRNIVGGLLVDAMLLMFTGPLAAVEMLTRRRARRPARRRAQAYEGRAIPVADKLFAHIEAGRRPRRDPSVRLSLADRLSHGDLDEQQFAVAMMFRSYRPEMHPMLVMALQSPTPAIRVQAAAVFAKLRERCSAEARALLDTSTDAPGELPRCAAACRALARSHFLDDAVIEALLARAAQCEARGTDDRPVSPTELPEKPHRGSDFLPMRRPVEGAGAALLPSPPMPGLG